MRNPDTFYSDNHYVVGAPSGGSVRYTFTRVFPLVGQAQLWNWMETSATVSGVTQTTEFWDYNTSTWVQADQQVIGTTDKLMSVAVPPEAVQLNPSHVEDD